MYMHVPICLCSCFRSLCSLWKSFSVVPGTKFAIIWELLIIAVILIVAWVYSYEVSTQHIVPISLYLRINFM